MDCPHCSSSSTLERKALTKQGYKCYYCRNCHKFFNERTLSPFNLLRYPSELIFKVVTWRLRYKLSLRDLSELLTNEGITISYETVRDWEVKFAPVIEDEVAFHFRQRLSSTNPTGELFLNRHGRLLPH
jgi:putative transposase